MQFSFKCFSFKNLAISRTFCTFAVVRLSIRDDTHMFCKTSRPYLFAAKASLSWTCFMFSTFLTYINELKHRFRIDVSDRSRFGSRLLWSSGDHCCESFTLSCDDQFVNMNLSAIAANENKIWCLLVVEELSIVVQEEVSLHLDFRGFNQFDLVDEIKSSILT